eukprot:2961687-Amphidinium_carterae.1
MRSKYHKQQSLEAESFHIERPALHLQKSGASSGSQVREFAEVVTRETWFFWLPLFVDFVATLGLVTYFGGAEVRLRGHRHHPALPYQTFYRTCQQFSRCQVRFNFQAVLAASERWIGFSTEKVQCSVIGLLPRLHTVNITCLERDSGEQSVLPCFHSGKMGRFGGRVALFLKRSTGCTTWCFGALAVQCARLSSLASQLGCKESLNSMQHVHKCCNQSSEVECGFP